PCAPWGGTGLPSAREAGQRPASIPCVKAPARVSARPTELLQNGHDRVTAVYVGAGCCRSSEAGQSRRAVHPLESRLKKLKEVYFQDNGARAAGLSEVRLTDIDYLDIEY
ncbi:hypothetical protein ACFQ71_41610, partial [Streptomyces sp. NPDC056534]